MKILETYNILNPVWLILGCIVVGVICYFIFFSKPQENFLHIHILRQAYQKNTWWYKLYISLIICISFLFFLALAEPVKIGTQRTVQKNGIDIEIVFDVSYSMIAEDIQPSRIEAAKTVFSDFVASLESDRVGLILFAGKPFQSVPLSYDYHFLQDFMQEISVDMIDQSLTQLQGTALGDALVLASGVLTKQENEREKIVILITDGEANKGIKPELALKLLKEKNIKTYTIGVGKNEDTTIDILLPSGFIQRTPVGGLDEQTLKKISAQTGGKYFRADSSETLKNILETIEKLEKKEDEYKEYDFHTSLKHIILALLCFPFAALFFLVFIKKIQL